MCLESARTPVLNLDLWQPFTLRSGPRLACRRRPLIFRSHQASWKLITQRSNLTRHHRPVWVGLDTLGRSAHLRLLPKSLSWLTNLSNSHPSTQSRVRCSPTGRFRLPSVDQTCHPLTPFTCFPRQPCHQLVRLRPSPRHESRARRMVKRVKKMSGTRLVRKGIPIHRSWSSSRRFC